MMSQLLGSRHTAGIDFQAVELLYDKGESSVGGRLSMLIIVPDQGKFDFVEPVLDGDMVQTILDQLQSKCVTLTMPKFEYDTGLRLTQVLSEMGMTDAFAPSLSDFSGINGKTDLFVGDVFHKAFVKVDEAGTEAAAATAVTVVQTVSVDPCERQTLIIDRPFVFLIRDHDTNVILFVGRVLDPTA